MHNLTRRIVTLLGISISASSIAAGLVGKAAPDFRLQDQKGEWHSIEQHRGQWIALYFYPKDDTPGCTKEACAFRDNIFAFDKLNAVILGVSLDDVASHAEFAEKYSLPFSLLADTDRQAATGYSVIMKVGPMEIDAATHSATVLADIRSLQAASLKTNLPP
jgi:thioredoxin-dependent peroxiredoxin